MRTRHSVEAVRTPKKLPSEAVAGVVRLDNQQFAAGAEHAPHPPSRREPEIHSSAE